jgi:hypothetical protein
MQHTPPKMKKPSFSSVEEEIEFVSKLFVLTAEKARAGVRMKDFKFASVLNPKTK